MAGPSQNSSTYSLTFPNLASSKIENNSPPPNATATLNSPPDPAILPPLTATLTSPPDPAILPPLVKQPVNPTYSIPNKINAEAALPNLFSSLDAAFRNSINKDFQTRGLGLLENLQQRNLVTEINTLESRLRQAANDPSLGSKLFDRFAENYPSLSLSFNNSAFIDLIKVHGTLSDNTDPTRDAKLTMVANALTKYWMPGTRIH